MIELKNISRVYQMGDQTVHALEDVSLTINDGEYVAIIGPSGSGKSTLMNVLGCLDNPSSGKYLLNGKDVSKLRDDQLADERNKHIGFVFQRFNLMGRISAVRNVEMPARYGGQNSKLRRQHAIEALKAVGLGDRVDHKPVELSGGQQQRVAIARALVNQPNILLADEPTGALDSKTGKDILDLFERLHRESGITLIVVTHDPSVARRADRVISIRDGHIDSDLASTHVADHTLAHDEPEAVVAQKDAVASAVGAAGAGIATATGVVSRNGKVSTNGHEGTVERDAALGRLANANGKPVGEGVGVGEAAVATPAISESPKAKAAPRLMGSQVLKRGLIAIVVAVIVNIALGQLAGVLIPAASRLPMFTPPMIGALTAVFGLLGVGVFALLNRIAAKPVTLFRLIATGALSLSVVPNIAIIQNPALIRQIPGASTGFGGTRTQGQGAQTGGTGAGGQTTQNGQGNRGGFVPGLGPLGALAGGNNTTGTNAAARRAGGAGFLTTPMIALMALHLVAFGIIVGVLTRGIGKKSRSPQLHASGLT